MKIKLLYGLLAALVLLVGVVPARAQGRAAAVRETTEYLLQHFGRPAFREGAGTLARRIEVYASRHGDEFIKAVRQVGPRTFHLVEEAGVHSRQAIGVMARYGEHGATWVVARPKAMQLLLQHGEEAAAVLVKHKGIAEPVLEKLGRPAIRALQVTNARGGRRLAMMVESGELGRIGRSPEVLDVIGRYGEPAMKFVWEHKGALATTVGLTAFLANPEAFINGARDLTKIVGENAVKPLMQVPAAAVEGVARGTNWTVIFLVAGAGGLLWWLAKHGYLSKWLDARLKPPALVVKPDAPASVNGDGASSRPGELKKD